jgi:hypothetical protein
MQEVKSSFLLAHGAFSIENQYQIFAALLE